MDIQTGLREPVSALPPAGAGVGEARQYLTFSIGSEMYAVGILDVKEIIEYGGLTEIPTLPTFIRGVINLRGAAVPIVDLAARFGGRESVVQKRTCNIIVEIRDGGESHDIGIMVDSVSAVLEIHPRDIEPAPRFGTRMRADFIAGMGKIDGNFVIILDIQRVLSSQDISLLTESASA